MSSKNPTKRVGLVIVFILCVLTGSSQTISTSRDDILSVIVNIAACLAFIVFCVAAMLAVLRGDKKTQIVSLALAAYAGINAAWLFIKACEGIANGWFRGVDIINLLLSLIFYGILFLYAAKELVAFPGKDFLDSSMIQTVAIVCIWILPIFQTFILPYFLAPSAINRETAGMQMLLTALCIILQSIAFTWFLKE